MRVKTLRSFRRFCRIHADVCGWGGRFPAPSSVGDVDAALASGIPAFGSGIAISVLYALSLGGAYGSQQAINAAGYAQHFGRDHLGAIRERRSAQ